MDVNTLQHKKSRSLIEAAEDNTSNDKTKESEHHWIES